MDVYHDYGNDLIVTPTGDLQVAQGAQLTNQYVVRRLLTTPISVAPVPDYIQQPTYGGGLPQYIGQLLTPALQKTITATILSQMFQQAGVAQTPPPTVSTIENQNQFDSATINYTNLITNSQAVVNLPLPPKTNQ